MNKGPDRAGHYGCCAGITVLCGGGDWEERHELQRQGIEVAKAKGRHLGRPKVEFPENWADCYDRWKEGTISAREAMALMGLKKDSFYRLVKSMKMQKNFQVNSQSGIFISYRRIHLIGGNVDETGYIIL